MLNFSVKSVPENFLSNGCHVSSFISIVFLILFFDDTVYSFCSINIPFKKNSFPLNSDTLKLLLIQQVKNLSNG